MRLLLLLRCPVVCTVLHAAEGSQCRKPEPELAPAFYGVFSYATVAASGTQAEYSPAPGEAVLLTSTTSAFASTGRFRLVSVLLQLCVCPAIPCLGY